MGSVEELAFARWGVRPALANMRFTEPGWSYEEPVTRPCPRCSGMLYSFRKPYLRNGRTQRYVALVCPRCPASFTLADLGTTKYDQVRQQPIRQAAPRPAAAGHRPRVVTGEDARRERILRFWRSVDLFGAPTLDAPDARKRRYEIRTGQPAGQQLPWQPGHPLSRQPHRDGLVWRHSVYGGVFELDRLHATLERVFGNSGPDVDERTPRGSSALFAVVATEDGRLLLDSLVLSTAAWAAGRALRPGPDAADWLDGFEAAADRFATTACELVAAAEDDAVASALARNGVRVSRPVDERALHALVRLAVEQLGVADALAPAAALRVHSDRVGRKRAHDAQADFLNSFYVDDLARIADAVAGGDCGPALAAFLTPDEALPATRRLDVQDPGNEDALLERLAPARVPAGRWPAKVSHPLATSQQLAINVIVERLGGQAGIFAVNGPPGTGKTTMLRDLVAALVVERAGRLAELPSPAAGFQPRCLAWRTGEREQWIRPLRADLAGFEIVVASANNGAVANVTKEIPQRKAIDEAWASQADYFAEHATRVLGEPAWGLVAARLGNKANCGEFVSRFWFGDSAEPTKKAADPTKQAAGRTKQQDDERSGFKDWLAAPVGPAGWNAAVSAFRAAVAAEQQLRGARQAAHDALRQLPALEQAHNTAEQAWQQAIHAQRAAEAAARQADQAAAAANQVARIAGERRRDHRAAKPGAMEILFTFGRAIRRWHSEDQPLAAAVAEAETALRNALAAAEAARRAAASAAHRAAAAAADRDRAAREVAAARHAIADARRRFADSVPDAGWCGDPARRELAGPWLDQAWNTARTRVFLAALDLHAAFIAGAATTMRDNLRVATDILTGQAPADVAEPVLRQAWQSLFLVVPVISTTFASVGRLLGRLGSEALGWLLIDEAGQAAPQAAVGAMWRSRRVIAVGDPLQLEPVVTALHTTQAALARHHGVAATWLPDRISVQGLADRVTSLGTWLPGPNGSQVWVGAPLRVHRRCDSPMFDVVNTAVYAGLMIHGTPPRNRPLAVDGSTWIDVTSTDADGHWIPAEGKAALQIIDDLSRLGVDPAQIMAISPFRDPARQLSRLLQDRYPQIVRGTVHTAQGKEADIVLFVLGGNPAKPGARDWAASKPNLLNVAVSRAKQRLYVIGNHDNWARLPYFNALARALPVKPNSGLTPPW